MGPAWLCVRGSKEQRQKEEGLGREKGQARKRGTSKHQGPRQQLEGLQRREGRDFSLSSAAATSFSTSCTACSGLSHSETHKERSVLGCSQPQVQGESRPSVRALRKGQNGPGHRGPEAGPAALGKLPGPRAVQEPAAARASGDRQAAALRAGRHKQQRPQPSRISPSTALPLCPIPQAGPAWDRSPGEGRFGLEPHGRGQQSQGATQEMGGQEGRHT